MEIDHVAIVVPHAEEAAEIFGALVGAEVHAICDFPSMTIRAVTLNSVEVHFIEFSSEHAEKRDAIPLGIHHLAIRVPSLDAAVERFHKAGVEALGAPVTTTPGVREVFLDATTAGGVPLQLVERLNPDTASGFDLGALSALVDQGRNLKDK